MVGFIDIAINLEEIRMTTNDISIEFDDHIEESII